MKKHIFLLLFVALCSYTGMAQTVLTKSGKQTTINTATATTSGIIKLAGDLTGSSDTPTVAPNAITTAKIQDNAVTTAKIVDGTISNSDLSTGVGGIYKGDGSLSTNTTVTQGAYNLNFSNTATSGTSHFTVDGTTLNVDANSNRVGIGTATPATTLEIKQGVSGNSGLRFTNLNSTNSGVASSSKLLGLNSTGDVILTNVPGSQDIVLFDGNTDTSPITATYFSPNRPNDESVIYYKSSYDYSSNAWRFDGTTYVPYNVPETTPWYFRYSYVDAGKNKNGLIWRPGDVQIGDVSDGGNLFIASGSSSSTGLNFKNVNSNSTPIARSTNVLGLDIAGNVILTKIEGTQDIVSFSTATPTSPGVVFTPDRQADYNVIYQSAVDYSTWKFDGEPDYVTYTPRASSSWNLANTLKDAGVNKLANIWRTGNVGFGNINPTEKLDVAGNIKFSGSLKPNNIAGTTGQVLTSQGLNAPPIWTTLSAASTPNIYSTDGVLSGSRTVAQGTNNLNFTSTATTGTSHFTVDGSTFNVNAASNRVGIGTTAPTTALNIDGNGHLFQIGSQTNDHIKMGKDTFGNGWIQFVNPFGTVRGNISVDYANGKTFINNDCNTNPVIFGTGVGTGLRLGINNSSPAHPIHVGTSSGSNGNGAHLTSNGLWNNASDRRLKDNIVDATYGLNAVMQLRPVQYTMGKDDNKSKFVGFIAQEVKQIVPEVVSGIEGDISKGEILGLSYDSLVPVLVNAIKEQQKMIQELKAEIELLKNNK